MKNPSHTLISFAYVSNIQFLLIFFFWWWCFLLLLFVVFLFILLFFNDYTTSQNSRQLQEFQPPNLNVFLFTA